MKLRKKIFVKGFFFICLLFLLTSTSTASNESITIAGTGDSQYLLRQLVDDFQNQHPGTKILVPNSVGSGGGIKLLLSGRTELARIARPLKPKEQAEGLQERIFAYSPIVFVANLPNQCLDAISGQQFIDMLRGKITNWKQLGSCPDHKIYIANREEGDSSKIVMEREIPEIKRIEDPAGRTIYSTPETFDTLNHYQYSFGYLPKSQIQKSSLYILKFDGVAASKENIQSGRYKLVVPLGIVWKDQPTGLTKKFLDYLFSAEAAKLMEELSAIPAAME